MLQHFLRTLRDLFSGPAGARERVAAGAPLDACVLEDRLLYSATAFPVDMVDADQLTIQVSQADIDALVSLVSQQLDQALPLSISPVTANLEMQPANAEATTIEPSSESLFDTEPPAATVAENFNAASIELVFIDSSVQDYDQLVNDLRLNLENSRQIEVVVLEESADGIQLIGEVLAQYAPGQIDAVHLVSHGVSGGIKLGNTWLTSETLPEHAEQLSAWQGALSDNADILLYGCDLAADDAGRTLVESLSMLTGADVSASVDATGASQVGGDWELEYAVGQIEAELAFTSQVQSDWSHLMAAATVADTFTSQSYTNNDGTATWSTGWVESDSQGGGATSGRMYVFGGRLYVTVASAGDYIYREANLAGALSASLSFDYSNQLSSAELHVQASADGGSNYTTVAVFNGSSNYGSASFTLDITSYAATNTRIRWLVINGVTGAGQNQTYFDNVQISYVTNTAPVLDVTKSPSLSSISEDAGAPSGAVGSLVSSLVDFATPSGQVDNVTDSDAGAQLGIAVTAANTANGTWWYSTNGGTNWNALGSLSSGSARLLAADANTRIYFQPAANYNGTLADAISFRAWDQSSGTNGGLANTSTNGGSTAFSSAIDTAALTVTSVNDAPTASSDSATAVEAGGTGNATAGTNPTGNVLSNDTDPDNADTRSIIGVAAGTVGSASGSVGATVTGSYGSIALAADGSYSYTVDNSSAAVQALRTSSNTLTDVFTYTMRDTAGSSSSTQITITIQGANDAPTNLSVAGMTIAENSSNGSAVGSLTPADPDSGDTFTYLLTDNANGRFSINASTGAITVANGAGLNYESSATHSITVRVTDAAGATYDKTFTITLTDTDEFDTGPVSDSNAAVNSVAESASVGTAVGITASASDADGTTNTITYALADDDGGRFAVNSTTGVVTLASAIDREADGASRNITVRATSADGSYSDQTFNVTIADVDEFDTGTVSDSNATGNSVAENASIGASVGITAATSDADATTNAILYSLVDDDGGRFAVDSTTGIVTVAGAIDREADGAIRNITVRATSADGSFTDQTFTINIADVDESDTSAISDTNASPDSVDENAANGSLVGITAAASDADATTNAILYSLDDDAGGRFAINSSTGVVTVANDSLLNYEAAASHTITVRATSADGSFRTGLFTIGLRDHNEFSVTLPADVDASANHVAENSAAGTAVGVQVQATDADGIWSAVAYSLMDDAGGRFVINSTTGLISVAAGADLNFEAAAAHTVTVRADSADASFATRSYTIGILNQNEAPTVAPSSFNMSSVDRLAVTRQTMQALISDPEGNSLTLMSVTSPSHGTLLLQADGSFTYQPLVGFLGVDQFMVAASDGQLSSAPALIQVNVTLPLAFGSGGFDPNAGGSSASHSSNLSSKSSNSSNSGSQSSADSGPTVVTEADIAVAGFAAGEKGRAQKQSPLGATHHAQNDAAQNIESVDRNDGSGGSQEEESEEAANQLLSVHFAGSSAIHTRMQNERLSLDERFVQHSLANQPWTIAHEDERSNGGKLSAYTFVEPAKWTAISTGMVLWSLRVYQVVATLASTARAWHHFDPITILQQSSLAASDDAEDDGLTEKMFDHQSDRQRTGQVHR